MKKKIISILIAIALLLFSFYYTNKSLELVKSIDPIMEEINNKSSKYEIKPQDASIKNDTIIPGLRGKEVDKKLSYSKMKKYGRYNESLTTIKDVKPKISIDKRYDKYIISGNKTKRQVSLIFSITSIEDLKTITNYLKSEHLNATLLIDSNLLDGNEELISTLNNFQLELNFKKIEDLTISTTSNYLDSITNSKNKYCISKEKDEKLLNLCKKHKMYTVIPNIILSRNPTVQIKKDLTNASIIMIDMNDEIRKELDYIIYYIKSRGYDLSRLDTLLIE